MLCYWLFVGFSYLGFDFRRSGKFLETCLKFCWRYLEFPCLVTVEILKHLLSYLWHLLSDRFVFKVDLAMLTFLVWAKMFSWVIGLAMMVVIYSHELGHVWAMRVNYMRTPGFYSIPFLGGVTVTYDKYPSQSVKTFVAIMGPFWGLLLAVDACCIYLLTKIPFFAGFSFFVALMNLMQLAPIAFLDGGLVMPQNPISPKSFSRFLSVVFILVTWYMAVTSWGLWIALAWYVGVSFVLEEELCYLRKERTYSFHKDPLFWIFVHLIFSAKFWFKAISYHLILVVFIACMYFWGVGSAIIFYIYVSFGVEIFQGFRQRQNPRILFSKGVLPLAIAYLVLSTSLFSLMHFMSQSSGVETLQIFGIGSYFMH